MQLTPLYKPALTLMFLAFSHLAQAQQAPHELDELTMAQLQHRVSSGALSYQQLTQFYIDRINAHNHQGMKLNAVITLNPEAIQQAKALDLARSKGEQLGILAGMPILLKDNIETEGAMPTTGGALALANNQAQQDAFLVRQLRQANAIILGKTNLSELANFRSTSSSSGWSDIGKQTRNPYVLNRTPCGSSSGSAVAVAANWAIAAIGTETDGSITCPSAHNALVGLKPTVGLVSRIGVIPLSSSQDSPGPMARTVADVAALLSVVAASDQNDSAHPTSHSPIDYRAHLITHGLQGKRLGIARNITEFNPHSSQAFEQAIAVLKHQGAVIVDDLVLPFQDELGDAEFDILLYDFKHDINQYLKNTPSQVTTKSLSELIAFNQSVTQTHPVFNQTLYHMANEKGALSEQTYVAAKKTVADKARTQGIDALMKAHKLDALIAPTNSPAWVIDTVNGDHFGGASSSPSAIAGYPIITVPMGFYAKLPLGLSFFADRYQEGKLIEMAYSFEQAQPVRTPPLFLPSID